MSFLTRFKQGLYLQVKSYKIRSLPFSIAHISDLHFDNTGKLPEWVRHSVFQYLSSDSVSILCVTGDLIDTPQDNLINVLDWLYNLPVDYVLISAGNHDYHCLSQLQSLYSSSFSSKLIFLYNSTFSYLGFNFIGLPDKFDPSFSLSSFMSLYSPFSYNFVLSHNPNSFLDLLNLSVQNLFVLSGHTHGGQIFYADFLRNLFKRFIKNKKILERLKIKEEHDSFLLHGTYNKKGNTLFINNGLGSHPPGRLFCPPMLSIFNSYD